MVKIGLTNQLNIRASRQICISWANTQVLSLFQNDTITWLLEIEGGQRSLRSLILRILSMNFSSMHAFNAVREPSHTDFDHIFHF